MLMELPPDVQERKGTILQHRYEGVDVVILGEGLLLQHQAACCAPACCLVRSQLSAASLRQCIHPTACCPAGSLQGRPNRASAQAAVCWCSVSECWNSVALSCGPRRHRGAQKATPSQANAAPQPCSRARGSYCAGCCCPRLPHPAACMRPAEQWRQVPMQQRAFSRGAARCCAAFTFPARARCPSCQRTLPGRQVNAFVLVWVATQHAPK